MVKRGVMTLAAVAAAALVAALALAHAGDEHGPMEVPAPYTELTHPRPGSAASTLQGWSLYAAKGCASCHGPSGGNVAEARLDDAAFVDEMSDAFLYWRISEGVPGTEMEAFKDRLTPEERWSLVSFLRALPAVGAALADPALGAGAAAAGAAEVASLRAENAALRVRVTELETAVQAPPPQPADGRRAAGWNVALGLGLAGLGLGTLAGLLASRAFNRRPAAGRPAGGSR